MNNYQDYAEAIYTYIKARRMAGEGVPSQREIAEHCGISVSSVSRCLDMLEAQGRITREPLKSRSIRLIEQDEEAQSNETAEAVYAYLVEEMRWGDVPSQREISEACFISRSEVRRALWWLEAQHRIELVDGQRNIRLVKD